MEYYFIQPKKLLAVDDTIIIESVLDFDLTNDFCIDAKSYNMFTRLKTNRRLKIDGNVLYIFADEGKYKTALIDKVAPKIEIGAIKNQNVYNNRVLQFACNFVSTSNTRPLLTGVLFDDFGGVYATDTFKLYKCGDNFAHKPLWSVPVAFIKELKENDYTLIFTDNYVVYRGDRNIYSRLYVGDVPDINKVIKTNNPNIITFTKPDKLAFLPCEYIDVKIKDNNIEFILHDDTSEFRFNTPCTAMGDIDIRFNYEQFNTALKLFDSTVEIRLDDALKPAYMNKGNEHIILMPMRVL